MADRDGLADSFRTDINGLRAVSIALVVAYHLAGRFAPGGFIGVDVFFVISGFLMTEIIVGGLRQGRFGLWAFYGARLRRIWPAPAALCAVLLALGATLIDPWTFERMAGDIPGALAFVSNIVFAGRLGYFAPDARTNWLLHTWSLSVEWQFYLLYPLLLMALFASPKAWRWLWPAIAALALGSFVLAVAFSARGQGWTFYLLPTRAWEMLAGALCAAAGVLKLGGAQRVALHVVGLAMIGLGAWVAIPAAGWPSVVALLPVGGASAVIVSGVRRTYWAENPVVVWLGRASYSIYLWHWPIVVALRYAAIPPTWPVTLGAVAAMLALGLASYWLIERWATQRLYAPGWPWRSARLAGVAALVGIAFAASATHGFEHLRTLGAAPAERAALAEDRAAHADWAYPGVCGHLARQGRLTLCAIGDPAAQQVLVIGDSHAEQIAPRYAHAFDGRPGQGMTFVTAGGCLPIPGVGIRYQGGGCARWSDAAFRFAEHAGFRRVVIVSAWVAYFEPAPGAPLGLACLATAKDCETGGMTQALAPTMAFERLADEVRALQRRGIEVVLMAPTPQGEVADPQQLYRRRFAGDLSAPVIRRADFERQAVIPENGLDDVHRITGAPLVGPLDALCPEGLCPVMDGSRDLFMDQWHYRASAMTGVRFAYLDPWLAPAAAPIRLK